MLKLSVKKEYLQDFSMTTVEKIFVLLSGFSFTFLFLIICFP